MVMKREKSKKTSTSDSVLLAWTKWRICNFSVNCIRYKKKLKVRWKTQIIEFFELFLCGVILFLNGNEKRKNRRKLPFLIQFYSRGQNGEFFGKLLSIQKKN